MRSEVHFTVNGEPVSVGGEQALVPLSDTLRYHRGLTGTKVVCAEGDCGACTVLLARVGDEPSGAAHFRSVNTCIFPTFLADRAHLVTIEGLEDESGLHEIQQSMVTHFGGQCGFCTPGIVMSLANLYEQKSDPSERHVKNALTGNLCRCTGYQPILEAALNADASRMVPIGDRYGQKGESEGLRERTVDSVLIEGNTREFFGPVTLDEAIEYRKAHPRCRLFSGATDIGVQINKGKDPGAHLMALHLIPELNQIDVGPDGVRIGARVSLDRLEEFAKTHLPPMAEFLSIFASPQIKNAATLIGNLANGSPIADTTPLLLALDARVELVGPQGPRTVAIDEFFTGYKTFAMKEQEFITHIAFSLPPSQSKWGVFKVSQRRDLDISSVSACYRLEVTGNVVQEARVAMGGVGPIPIRLKGLEADLKGATLDRATADRLKKRMAQEIQPISDVRGTDDYRRNVSVQLFEKYLRENFDL